MSTLASTVAFIVIAFARTMAHIGWGSRFSCFPTLNILPCSYASLGPCISFLLTPQVRGRVSYVSTPYPMSRTASAFDYLVPIIPAPHTSKSCTRQFICLHIYVLPHRCNLLPWINPHHLSLVVLVSGWFPCSRITRAWWLAETPIYTSTCEPRARGQSRPLEVSDFFLDPLAPGLMFFGRDPHTLARYRLWCLAIFWSRMHRA